MLGYPPREIHFDNDCFVAPLIFKWSNEIKTLDSFSSHLYKNYDELKLLIKDPSFFRKFRHLSARAHSKELDKCFGLRIPKIEMNLVKEYRPYFMTEDSSNKKQHFKGTETWIGLHPQVLQTPYSEICEFFHMLAEFDIKKVVDLGAGYGRIGIVANAFYSEVDFTGYEILNERLDEANRIFDLLDLNNCKMVNENILEEGFELPEADLYFIYDFSNPLDLRVILKKLSAQFSQRDFFFVAKGEGIRSLIQNKYPEFFAVNGVIHNEHWSLYSSFVDLDSK